jgi:hypothetical protein
MTDRNQSDEDAVPMNSAFGSFPVPLRWVALVALTLANVVVTLFVSNMPTGYTLGVATAPLVWGLLAALVVWLIRGRRTGTFGSAFFWVTLVFASLALLKALGAPSTP